MAISSNAAAAARLSRCVVSSLSASGDWSMRHKAPAAATASRGSSPVAAARRAGRASTAAGPIRPSVAADPSRRGKANRRGTAGAAAGPKARNATWNAYHSMGARSLAESGKQGTISAMIRSACPA